MPTNNVNAATVTSITNNIKKIIEDTLKYSFENQRIDRKTEFSPNVVLEQLKATPNRNHGEGPMYVEQEYLITVKKKIENKQEYRETSASITFDFEENITVDTLNVEDLALSKLVTVREMEIDVEEYNGKDLVVDISLLVRFRDLRT